MPGLPMKRATNMLDGIVVDVGRRADLLNFGIGHDDDAVAHGHRLDLVVRHVDGGGMLFEVQAANFGAHDGTKLGVECSQRFVHQEGGWLAHKGAGQGRALPVAAAQRAWLAIEQMFDA